MAAAGVVMVVVVLVVVGEGARFSPRIRHARQVDTTNISNDRLLCLFQADVAGTGRDKCDHLTGSCTCVPFYQCTDNLIQPDRDAGLLPVVNVRVNGLACEMTEHICCENVDTSRPNPAEKLTAVYKPRCGVRQPDGVDANFQGFINRQAQFGEFPWMAAVISTALDPRNGAPAYICGASLIHPQAVLTAAHYVHDMVPSELSVRLGEWNFKEPSETRLHQDIQVNQIVLHPKFVLRNLEYNVALLLLVRRAQLGPTIDTICLPNELENFVGPGCYSSGWGKEAFTDTGAFQQIMKSIDLPAVDNPTCQTAMRGTRLGPDFRLHSSFMCAGGEAGKDVCTGDGGSPLVCPMASDPSRYVQAGVVSWGIGCGQEGIPGVYAAVSHAVTWIQKIIMDNFSFDLRAQA